jgi:hypothetical protein
MSPETTERLAPGLALGPPAREILTRGRMQARLGDSDPVQSEVELALPFLFTVPALAPRGGVERWRPLSVRAH